jgi:peptidoglycan/LPS O-acetylase OafA/YrhL
MPSSCRSSAVIVKASYEPALDGIRGLAVLSVMVFHAVPTQVSGGFLGVDIFFALSGYLITGLLLAEYEKTGKIDFSRFFAKRWFRLMPALLLMLIIYGAVIWMFKPSATLKNQGVDILAALLYITNWVRVGNLNQPTDLGHTWSLGVEAQFYLVWPFILLVLLRYFGVKLRLLIAVVSLAGLSYAIRYWLTQQGVDVSRVYNGADARAETLMWGAALAVALKLNSMTPVGAAQKSRTWPGAAAWLSLTALLVMIAKTKWLSDFYYQIGITLVALLSLLLIAYLHRFENTLLRRVFEHRILVWVGAVSYGLYVWHFPIYQMVISWGFEGWYLLAVGLLVTVPTAAISYYGLERPVLNWYKTTTSA